MPRADRSIAILTGMIIAALYVILLVGFTQESYMRRDAESRVYGTDGWAASHDVAKRVCRIEPPLCKAGAPAAPLTLERLRRELRPENQPGGTPFRIKFPALYWSSSSTTERR